MKLSDEEQLAYRLRQTLNLGTEQLDSGITRHLSQARMKALEQQAEHTNPLLRIPGTNAIAGVVPWVKAIAMALALSIGAIGTYYWNQFEEAGEHEEIDSALLADEIPPSAYIDQGFRRWLEHSSPSSGSQ